jgi:hypothetical protein
MVEGRDFSQQDSADSGGVMLYDLRSYHANLCGAILIKLQDAMAQDDLALLFKLITENLYTEVQQKLDKKEKEKYWEMINGYKNKDGKEIEGILKTIEKNPFVFNNNSSGDKLKRTEVKWKIYNLMWYLRNVMEKNKMFGGKEFERI